MSLDSATFPFPTEGDTFFEALAYCVPSLPGKEKTQLYFSFITLFPYFYFSPCTKSQDFVYNMFIENSEIRD